jgi:hypothetical protein
MFKDVGYVRRAAISANACLDLQFAGDDDLRSYILAQLAGICNYILLNESSEFNSCFISYATKDQDFADRLHADLRKHGVRCWFAPRDIQAGKKIYEQIDIAIQMHERLLLLLSEASIKSEWVKTEIAKARKREISEKRRILFPLRLVTFETLRQWECFDSDNLDAIVAALDLE